MEKPFTLIKESAKAGVVNANNRQIIIMVMIFECFNIIYPLLWVGHG
jgi:hypothetical protein